MIKIASLYLVLFFYSNIVTGQSIVNIQHLTTDTGLSDQVVYAGYQDEQGFVWLATRRGLNRYDGHSFQIFTKSDSYLQEKKIIQLAGRANTLFLLYGLDGVRQVASGKIDVFDTKSCKSKPLEDYIPIIPFKVQDVVWISADAHEKVTFLTKDGLVWQLDTNLEFHNITYQKIDSTFTFTSNPNHLAYGDFISIASNTRNQTLVFRDSITHQLFGKDHTWYSVFINKMVVTLKYENKQLFQYDLAKEIPVRIKPYPTDIYSTDIPFYHYNDPISAISIFYIPGSGLFRLGNTQSEFISSEDNMNLHPDQINAFFLDKSGQYWICTTTGVYIIKSALNKFKPYFTSFLQKRNPVITDQARGIALDDKGNIYAGIWNTLAKANIQTNESQFTANPSRAIIYPLCFHDNRIYAGSRNLLSTGNNGDIVEHGVFEDQEIWSIASINDSILLLGLSNDLFKFNTNQNSYSKIESKNSRIPPIRYIYRIIREQQGKVLAVGEDGIYILSKDLHITEYLAKEQLQAEKLNDLFIDSSGFYWIATSDRGLIKYHPDSGILKSYSRQEEFPTDLLYRIESDPYGYLWISSNQGLIQFNKSSESLRVFDRNDGLPFTEFNRISSYKSKDNRLFFGGLNGIFSFDPADFIHASKGGNAPMVLSSITKFSPQENKWIDIREAVIAYNELNIQPSDRLFNIGVSMLDFQPGKYTYFYKFKGLDDQWNLLEDNIIQLTGLPIGNYSLYVKGINPNGVQSKEYFLLDVNVLSPFYLKGWFIILSVATLVILVILIIKWRTISIREQKLALENLVSTRTNELAKAVEIKDALLKEIKHRIKNNLAIMDGMLDLEKEKIKDKDAAEAFEQSQRRLQSISLIHEHLSYETKTSEVNIKSYIEELVQKTKLILNDHQTIINSHINLTNNKLPSNLAIPLGLIINELLTNSYKYARTPTEHLCITIDLHEDKDQKLVLVYQDNGPGIENINELQEKSLGIRLIYLFCKQLGITPQYNNKPSSIFTFHFEAPIS